MKRAAIILLIVIAALLGWLVWRGEYDRAAVRLRESVPACEVAAVAAMRAMSNAVYDARLGVKKPLAQWTPEDFARVEGTPPPEAMPSADSDCGYRVTYKRLPDALGRTGKYEIYAAPSADLPGARYFIQDIDGVVRFERGGPAGPGSPPIR